MGLSLIMCYIECRRDTLMCYMFLIVSLCVEVNLIDNMKYGITLRMRTQHGAVDLERRDGQVRQNLL